MKNKILILVSVIFLIFGSSLSFAQELPSELPPDAPEGFWTYIGSGKQDFGTSSKPMVKSFSLYVTASAFIAENGALHIQYHTCAVDLIGNMTKSPSGTWRMQNWCYVATNATKDGQKIQNVKNDLGLSANSLAPSIHTRTYIINSPKDGHYMLMGDGKGEQQLIGNNYRFCEFDVSEGEIENMIRY